MKVHDARNALEALLAGREIKIGKTNTFRCSIKWLSKEELVKRYMAALAAEPEGLKELNRDDPYRSRF